LEAGGFSKKGERNDGRKGPDKFQIDPVPGWMRGIALRIIMLVLRIKGRVVRIPPSDHFGDS